MPNPLNDLEKRRREYKKRKEISIQKKILKKGARERVCKEN